MNDTLIIKLSNTDDLVVRNEEQVGVTYTLRDRKTGKEECADEALIPRVTAALPHLDAYEVHLEVMKIVARVITWLGENKEEPEEDYTPDFDAAAKERRVA